jgi:hypothetical protein
MVKGHSPAAGEHTFRKDLDDLIEFVKNLRRSGNGLDQILPDGWQSPIPSSAERRQRRSWWNGKT